MALQYRQNHRQCEQAIGEATWRRTAIVQRGGREERVHAPLLCTPMNRIFLAVITSALLLLLTSASLLVYRAATPSGETAEVAKRHTTVGVKR